MIAHFALATNRYEMMESFYTERLGFPIVDSWNHKNGRGVHIQLPGLVLELLDNDCGPCAQMLGASLDRVRLVIEVEDIDETRDLLDIETPIPQTADDGKRSFQLRDPDGLPVTFMQPKPHPQVARNDELKRGYS